MRWFISSRSTRCISAPRPPSKAKDGKTFKVTKGAPQVILELSANAAQVKPAVEKAVNDFAARGFRSLGVARAEGDGQWQFLGVLPLFDPPREDAKATVATAGKMGVKIKMVTGDALAIAKETAKKLDMGTNILDAASLGDSKKQETAEVAESIEKADGFAQVFPEHKFHIVDVLQKRGHIVGMTGDGVNDAPALKKADCGIAVSGATDAARAAAAIVLMAPGLSVIIDAIKESRQIFQRMNSYAIYRIAETLRVLFFMTLAILVFNFYPVTAVMIVMLALLNDGAILSIAYDNVHYKDQPEAWNMRMVLGISTVLGVVGVIAAFALFYIGEENLFSSFPSRLDRAHIQTLMYLKLSVAGHLTIFLTRTRGPFWSIRPARILWGAVLGTQIVATLIAVFGIFMAPISWGWALFVWGYALVWALLNDRVKLVAYSILDRTEAGATPEARAQHKIEAKVEPKPETKPEPKADTKPDTNAEAKPEAEDKLKKQTKPSLNSKHQNPEPTLRGGPLFNLKQNKNLSPPQKPPLLDPPAPHKTRKKTNRGGGRPASPFQIRRERGGGERGKKKKKPPPKKNRPYDPKPTRPQPGRQKTQPPHPPPPTQPNPPPRQGNPAGGRRNNKPRPRPKQKPPPPPHPPNPTPPPPPTNPTQADNENKHNTQFDSPTRKAKQ